MGFPILPWPFCHEHLSFNVKSLVCVLVCLFVRHGETPHCEKVGGWWGGRKGGGPIAAFAMAVPRIPVSPYPRIPTFP